MIFDFHVHTMNGSSDSGLSVEGLVEEAQATGLDGICLTEHQGPWNRFQFRDLCERTPGIVFVNAMEVDSPLCHLTVFGLERHGGGLHDPALLRRIADSEGAVVVLAHPFRNFIGSRANNLLFRGFTGADDDVVALASHPIFDLVDAVEVSNGGTSAAENDLAFAVAKHLGRPMVGGSDAHSTHGLGRFVTILDGKVADGDGVVARLKAGRVHAATNNGSGEIVPVGPLVY